MDAGITQAVLVVDDDRQVRAYVARALETAGFRVTTAASGSEALQEFSGHPDDIALVIVDQRMPGMTGDELVAALRKANPELSVLRIVGDRFDAPAQSRRMATLAKPFRPDELIARVTSLLSEP